MQVETRENRMDTKADKELTRVLVVEDESDIRYLISLALRREGYRVDEAETAEEAWDRLQEQTYQLIVLDWMLPGASGLSLLNRIKSSEFENDCRVIMVTAKGESSDIILGLSEGADDYVSKPFDVDVLAARVKSVLRRKDPLKELNEDVIEIGELKVIQSKYEAYCGEAKLELTKSEFKLLTALAHHRGRVLSRKQLIEEVQGRGIAVVDRAIDTHVFGLRKKMGKCADCIETIRGVGYRVIP